MGKVSKTKNNVILGIDPGSTTIGYGLINCIKGAVAPKLLSYGYIDLSGIKEDSEKLLHLNKDLKELIKEYKPDVAAVESLFYFKNLKTFSPVMQSRGVILLTLAQCKLKAFEYTPLQVKQTVAGHGRADKSMVEKLVKNTLNIKSKIRPDDASDALAIAICHFRSYIG